MARYIDADALINFLDETVPYDEMFVSQYNADWIYSFIECAPTIEARPVVRGAWKLNDDGSGTCRQCGRTTKAVWDADRWHNFCPNCGADMRGEEDAGSKG